MFKRVIWWTTGAVMGAAGSALAQRKVKKQVQATVQRYAPPAVADRAKQRVIDTAHSLVDDVRDAIDEGRDAAVDRQLELRRKLLVGRPAADGLGGGHAVREVSGVESNPNRATVTPIRPGHPSGERPHSPAPTRSQRWARVRRRG